MKGPLLANFGSYTMDLLDPDPKQIKIEEIAYRLARNNRFLGNVKGEGYSVAQHSVVVANLVEPEFAMHALLHDGPEAYYGDIVNYIKEWLVANGCDLIEKLDAILMAAIAKRFSFELTDESHVVVKRADILTAKFEKEHVTKDAYNHGGIYRLSQLKIFDKFGGPKLMPSEAEQLFLETFRNVSNKNKQVSVPK